MVFSNHLSTNYPSTPRSSDSSSHFPPYLAPPPPIIFPHFTCVLLSPSFEIHGLFLVFDFYRYSQETDKSGDSKPGPTGEKNACYLSFWVWVNSLGVTSPAPSIFLKISFLSTDDQCSTVH